MRRKLTLSLILSLCACAWTGCSQRTINSAAQDTQHNVAIVDQQAKGLEQQAKPQLDKLGLGARVTAAIQANANLPHTIRVDASATGVRLRGTVSTPAQKQLAGHIAAETLGPGKTVKNEISVR